MTQTTLTTPWSPDQIESLNEYQEAGVMHPFTCGHGSHTLRAEKEGWVCDECVKAGRTWTQNWCMPSWQTGRGKD